MAPQVNGAHNAGTGAPRRIDNLYVAGMDIRDNVAVDPQQEVSVDIIVFAVAEVGISVGNAEALVSGP